MFDQNKQHQNSRLGKILLKRQYVNQAQLDEALRYQRHAECRLGEALIDLGYIDNKQLKRALRNQNWLRSLTACAALVLAPFSPAFAAGQGSSGTSSTASTEISLTILPDIVNTSASAVHFSPDNQSKVSSGLCTSDFNTELYRVVAEGSGEKGAFVLTDDNQDELSYQVSFQQQGQEFQNLAAANASNYFNNNITSQLDSNCSDANDNRIKVSLDNQVDPKDKSVYSGHLTITIAAE